MHAGTLVSVFRKSVVTKVLGNWILFVKKKILFRELNIKYCNPKYYIWNGVINKISSHKYVIGIWRKKFVMGILCYFSKKGKILILIKLY